MDEIMLRIDNVSKMYKLGQIGGTTLRDELQRKMAKLKGQEDPTRQIGAKNYNQGETFMALDGVSFDVKKGERVGIIGHNGAGKSTLLKLISRVTAPTGGKIQMNGRVASMLEVGTGFHGELTGRENIYMNGAILGMTRKEIDAKIEDIIEFSEVRQFIDTPVKRYSSGMYVKLAFSVAAHLDSEIMIMDEVLAVGDMAFQKKCLDKMNDVSKTQGRTILYVSHNMNTIRQMCDRVVVLDHGKVVFDGGVEEGISIYCDMAPDISTIIDYSKIDRLSWLTDTKLRMMRSELLNKDNAFFESNEEMRIRLSWKNEKDIHHLCLRIEMLRADRSPIGTAVLMDFYSGQKGEKADCCIKLNVHSLASGTYTMNYNFFEKGLASNQTIDCVHGHYFIINNKETDSIGWNNLNWGCINLPSVIQE